MTERTDPIHHELQPLLEQTLHQAQAACKRADPIDGGTGDLVPSKVLRRSDPTIHLPCYGVSQEEMTSLFPHPSLPMVGGGVVPEVTRVGEWTLLPSDNSTLESRPCTLPRQHNRAHPVGRTGPRGMRVVGLTPLPSPAMWWYE